MLPIEDVIIRFEPLRRPKIAAGIQGKEFKVARFGDRAVRRTAQLDANLDWLVDLKVYSTIYMSFLVLKVKKESI